MEYVGEFVYNSRRFGDVEVCAYFKLIYTPEFDCWSDCYLPAARNKAIDIRGDWLTGRLYKPLSYEINGKTYDYLITNHCSCDGECGNLPIVFVKLDDRTMMEIDFFINREDSVLPLTDIETDYDVRVFDNFSGENGNSIYGFTDKNGYPVFGDFGFTKYEFTNTLG